MKRARLPGSVIAVLFGIGFSPYSFSDIVSIDLSLVTPTGPTNNIEITMTEAGLGPETQTAAVSGTLPVNLDIFFDGATQEGLVTGIEFADQAPGPISIPDLTYSNYGGDGLIIDTVSLQATADTPSPLGTVSSDQFSTDDHEFILNSGFIDFDHTINNYGANPLTNITAGQIGLVMLSAPVISSTQVMYNVAVELPVDFAANILSDVFYNVDMAMTGRVVGAGQFSRTLPTPVVKDDGGASNATMNSAVLNGELVSTGESATAVSVFYGTSDGGTEKVAWDQVVDFGVRDTGFVSTNITGLIAGISYYYRFYASNTAGEAWADSTETFETMVDFADFPYRMKIGFAGYTGDETLSNFPVLVKFGPGLPCFDYGQFTSSTGKDLRFSADDASTPLNFEIEEWNTAGDSYAWVQVPALTSNAFIYAWWGNPAVTSLPGYAADGSTWSDEFLAVWHLNEKAVDETALTTHRDATPNLLDGLQNNNAYAPAVIAGGQRFDGNNDYINFGDIDVMDTPGVFTASFWFNRSRDNSGDANETNHGVDNVLVAQSANSGNDNLEIGSEGSNLELYLDTLDLDGPNPQEYDLGLVNDTWYHVALTYDLSQPMEARIYLDGVLVQEESQWGSTLDGPSPAAFSFGAARMDIADPWGDYTGLMDEFRLSSVARSSNWVSATYLTVADNETFTTYNEVEGAITSPIVLNEAANNMGAFAATLNGMLNCTGAAPTEVSVYWGMNDGGTVKANWANVESFGVVDPGYLSTNLTGLTTATDYFFRFYATNSTGEAWADATGQFSTRVDVSVYSHFMQITLDGYVQGEALYNFPVLVKVDEELVGFDYDQFASGIGNDLRFTDSDQLTVLNHEIDHWETNGESLVWVQVPELVNPTTIWAFWGNPAEASAPPAFSTNGAAWTENFNAVYHLSETNGTHFDSSANAHDAAPIGVLEQDGAGMVDGADYFDGAGGRLEPNSPDPGFFHDPFSEHSFSGWVTMEADSGPAIIYEEGATGGGFAVGYRTGPEAFVFGVRQDGPLTELTGNADFTPDSNTFVHVAAVFDNGELLLYVDGQLDASVTSTNGTSVVTHGDAPGIGNQAGNTAFDINEKPWVGIIDEVRLSDTAWSADYVWATYASVAMNDTLNSFSLAEGPIPQITNEGGPSNIGTTTADVSGSLLSTGGAPTEVIVYYGTTDGGTDGVAWDHFQSLGLRDPGAVTTNLTGLSEDTTYYYRYAATNVNGIAWADDSPAFTTRTTALDPGRYAYRLTIPLDGYDRGETLTNFPVLVVLGESVLNFRYSDFASSTGGDLRFTAGDQVTVLNHEIENWDLAGASHAWVQVPALSTNTVIYAYWGNPDAVIAPPYTTDGSTWTEDFTAVWHLADDAGASTALDSTTNRLDSDITEAKPEFPGLIDGAFDFDGNNDVVNIDNPPELQLTTMTVTFWVHDDDFVDGANSYITKGQSRGADDARNWDIFSTGSELVYMGIGPDDTMNFWVATDSPLDDGWHHVVALWDGTTDTNGARLYVDGQLTGMDTALTNALAQDRNLHLGGHATPANELDGQLDEVRISPVVRSSNWIWAAYLNTASNEVFNAIRFVEGGDTPVVSNDGGASNISTDGTADLNGELMYTGSAPTEVSVYWGTTDGGTSKTNWENLVTFGLQDPGFLTTTVSNLLENTSYYYRFYATNAFGEFWPVESATFNSLALQPILNTVDVSDVLPNSATFNTELVSTGSATTAVSVYWGTSDEGTSKGAWDQVAGFGMQDAGFISTNMSGLINDTTYYYRYYATNFFGETWTDASVGFSTPTATLDPARYAYRLPINLVGYDRVEPLTNFPVAVELGENILNFKYDDFASSTGGDLRFTSSDGTTPLNHELENWDPASSSFAWVQIPELTGNVLIYAYWGNPDAVVAPPYTTDGSTWSEDFEAVWHFAETGAVDRLDSTANDNHSVPQNYEGDEGVADGIINGADLLDGSDEYLAITNLFYSSTGQIPEIVVSGWIQSTSAVNQYIASFDRSDYWRLAFDDGEGTGNVGWDTYATGQDDLGTTNKFNDGEWHHICGWFKAGTNVDKQIFVDGVLVASDSAHAGSNIGRGTVRYGFIGAGSEAVTFNGAINDNTWIDGRVDEVRIENIARSTNWIWATFLNIASNDTFSSMAFAEGEDPVITNDGGASNITAAGTADLNGDLVWTGSAPAEVSVYYGTTDGGASKAAWSNMVNLGVRGTGLVTTTVGGLPADTQHFYRFYSTNAFGATWAADSAAFMTLRLRPTINNDGGASNVTVSAAELTGELVSTGAAPTEVFVYWGLSDGGTDPGSWDQVVESGMQDAGYINANVSTLTSDTTYYYRYYASNSFGESWADSSSGFTTLTSALETNRYGFRMRIDFSGYDREEVLTNFPLLVALNENLTGFNYSDFASVDGGDLRFAGSDGTTPLSYEVEDWDTTSDSYIWVGVPTLESNDFIYAYWGNPGAPVAPPYTTDGSTWDASFEAVWHLSETANPHLDATRQGRDGTAQQGVLQDVAGLIDGAAQFDGIDDVVLASYKGVGADNPRSVSFWMQGGPQNESNPTLVSWGNSDTNAGERWTVRLHTDATTLRAEVEGGNIYGTAVINDGGWHHVAISWDNSGTSNITDAVLYVDGLEDVVASSTPQTVNTGSDMDLHIGNGFRDGNRGFTGLMDEVRIHGVVRSSNWVWAAYANQQPGSTLADYQPVEELREPDPDEDGDGIPDWWEVLHFGGATNAVATADDDGDGFDNLSEWIAFTIPTNSESFFELIGIAESSSFEIFFLSATNRFYTLQYMYDRLGTAWSNIQDQVRQEGDGLESSLIDTNDGPKRNYRIEVSE